MYVRRVRFSKVFFLGKRKLPKFRGTRVLWLFACLASISLWFQVRGASFAHSVNLLLCRGHKRSEV